MISSKSHPVAPSPLFERSVETRLAASRIDKLASGEIVSYAELKELIGLDPQTDGYSIIYQARKIVLREDGMVTRAVENVGIKRLTDSEIANSSGAASGRIRRMAQRQVAHLATIDDANLTPEERIRRHASAAAFAVVKLMTKEKTQARIAFHTTIAGELPLARTLALFQKPTEVK